MGQEKDQLGTYTLWYCRIHSIFKKIPKNVRPQMAYDYGIKILKDFGVIG